MARSNPLIALAGKNLPGPLASFRQGGRDALTNEALRTRTAGEQQRQDVTKESLEIARTEAARQASELAEFESIVRGVNELEPIIPTSVEEVPRFLETAQRRSNNIRSTGGKSQDTDDIIRMAQAGDFEGIRREFTEVRELERQLRAKQLGITSSEGFTLGAGQTRFGPGGQAVATGATTQPTGFTLSPGQTRFGAGGEEIATGGIDPETSLRAEERLTKKREAALRTEEGLRKEVNTLLKDFFKVADANSRVQVSAQDPSPAGDLALVFNFMKMLDPGSTVREGEFANAAQTGSLESALRNKFGKVFSGEILEFTREDFIEKAAQLFQAAQGEAQKTADAFERIAIGAEVDVDRVLATFQERRQDINGGGSQPAAPAAAIAFLRANDTAEHRAQFVQKFGSLPEGF